MYDKKVVTDQSSESFYVDLVFAVLYTTAFYENFYFCLPMYFMDCHRKYEMVLRTIIIKTTENCTLWYIVIHLRNHLSSYLFDAIFLFMVKNKPFSAYDLSYSEA